MYTQQNVTLVYRYGYGLEVVVRERLARERVHKCAHGNSLMIIIECETMCRMPAIISDVHSVIGDSFYFIVGTIAIGTKRNEKQRTHKNIFHRGKKINVMRLRSSSLFYNILFDI